MTATDVRVLTAQKIIRGIEWEHLKREPGALDNYIRHDMRHMVAEAIATEGLGRFVTSEPSGDPRDPLNEENAVLRLTVGVVSKSDAARFALDLSEAEERGFAAALSGLAKAMDQTLALSNASREAHYASVILDGLIRHLTSERKHRPAADWRPMWSIDGYSGRYEYLFEDGSVASRPRLSKPKPADVFDFHGTDTLPMALAVNDFEAIAWRHAGRHPHTERAA